MANDFNPSRKHNIVDMYWLINLKLFQKQELDENEAGLLSLGYNADFGNLRVGFYEITKNSFTNSSMIRENMKSLTSINLFSETCQQIKWYIDNRKQINIMNFERMLSASNTWVPNVTKIVGDKDTTQLTIRTKTSEDIIYTFNIMDWQMEAFLSCVKYLTNGNSWDRYLQVKSLSNNDYNIKLGTDTTPS